MTDNTIIRKHIMRRVYIAYYLRKAFSPLLLKVYGLAIAFGGVAAFVSISNVIANIPLRSIEAFLYFTADAFITTGVVVQALTAGIAVLAFLIAQDIVRTLAHTAPRHA